MHQRKLKGLLIFFHDQLRHSFRECLRGTPIVTPGHLRWPFVRLALQHSTTSQLSTISQNTSSFFLSVLSGPSCSPLAGLRGTPTPIAGS